MPVQRTTTPTAKKPTQLGAVQRRAPIDDKPNIKPGGPPPTSAHDVDDTVTGRQRSNQPVHGGGRSTVLNVRLDGKHKKLDADPIRAHIVVGQRAGKAKTQQVSFEKDLPDAPAVSPGAYKKVAEAEVDKAWKAGLKERARQLRDIDASPSAPPITPEDGTVKIAAFHMGFGAMDQAAERFIEQMADIGRVEGFRIVVRVMADDADDLLKMIARAERNNVTVVPCDSYHDIWSEDGGEVRRDRSIGVPGTLPEGMQAPVEILKARLLRATGKTAPRTDDVQKLYALLQQHAPDQAFGCLGEVFAREAQKSFVGLALSSGQPLRVSFSTIEGGNMLAATNRAGETVALVGRDSWELTRRVLETETGTRFDDDAVRRAVAKDTGVPPERVLCVEQPGDYHLDVKMVPIGPGELLMNDALEAARIGEQHMRAEFAQRHKPGDDDYAGRKKDLERNVKYLHDRGKHAAVGEAKAQAELEQAGFTVHRVPAVFPWVGGLAPVNFLNAEQGTGKDGQKFYIALGGDKDTEKMFLDALTRACPHAAARYYFLDRALTHATLTAGGGINCRCKPEAVQS